MLVAVRRGVVPVGLRAALTVVAVGTAALGVWAGLVRLGWRIGTPPAAGFHGLLMVLGFLGTVIGMERAVGLGRRWAWAAPAASAGAAVLLLAGGPARWAGWLLVAAGAVLAGVFVVAHRIQPEAHIRVMGLGAVCWLVAAAAWTLGAPIPRIVPALAGFLVSTIAGERLELARTVAASPTARRVMTGAALAITVGATAAAFGYDPGLRVTGLGMLAAAGWLAVGDVARRTIRMGGLTRYMAAGLLTGYAWLGTAGLLWTFAGLTPGGFLYDAALHAVFLGFVMSMVFAHAPVIFPALTGIPLPHHRGFWWASGLLHAGVALRVASDLAGWVTGVRWGGMANAAALALFALAVGYSLLRTKRPPAASNP